MGGTRPPERDVSPRLSCAHRVFGPSLGSLCHSTTELTLYRALWLHFYPGVQRRTKKGGTPCLTAPFPPPLHLRLHRFSAVRLASTILTHRMSNVPNGTRISKTRRKNVRPPPPGSLHCSTMPHFPIHVQFNLPGIQILAWTPYAPWTLCYGWKERPIGAGG